MIYIKREINIPEYLITLRTEMIYVATLLGMPVKFFIPINFILKIEQLNNPNIQIYDNNINYMTYSIPLMNQSSNINYVTFLISQFEKDSIIYSINDMPLGQYKYSLIYTDLDLVVDEGLFIIADINDNNSIYLRQSNNDSRPVKDIYK